ncbi:hypothetical protein GUY60_04860, partial [Streptomyces sp. YC537]|nr:hypothetical protein [Streptomyces boluensis]
MALGRQLHDDGGEFASYFEDLLSRLDQEAGWCGVFWQRDPDGMAACLDGAEVPPWDVVQALLHDLAADHGTHAAERETALARTLHEAARTAHDARPGVRQLLGERLDLMLVERRYAAERQADLAARLPGAAPEDVERLRLDLAWARDDHERATARSAELRFRIEELERSAPSVAVSAGAEGAPDRPARASRRPRGARFAGVEAE